AVILGAIGDNFGAGMTGGMAFVYDPHERLPKMVNPDSILWRRLGSSYWEGRLKALIEEHYERTGSARARALLDDWKDAAPVFWQICPKEMVARLEHPLEDHGKAAAI